MVEELLATVASSVMMNEVVTQVLGSPPRVSTVCGLYVNPIGVYSNNDGCTISTVDLSAWRFSYLVYDHYVISHVERLDRIC
jgi:hypothetical protein